MFIITAVLRLIRPLHLVISLLAVILGAVLSYGSVSAAVQPAVITAAFSAMLIAAAGGVLRGGFGMEVNPIDRPDRPRSSWVLSAAAAQAMWAALTVAGLAVAALVSWMHLALGTFAVLLLYLYSARFNRFPMLGNATVALVVALAIIYGGLVPGSPYGAVVASVFAFLTTFARKVVKEIQSMEVDALAGLTTLPIAHGARAARAIFMAVILLAILLTPIPFLAMDYGPLFLLLVLITDLVLLRCIWLAPHAPPEAAAASAWLKGGMLVGIAALVAA